MSKSKSGGHHLRLGLAVSAALAVGFGVGFLARPERDSPGAVKAGSELNRAPANQSNAEVPPTPVASHSADQAPQAQPPERPEELLHHYVNLARLGELRSASAMIPSLTATEGVFALAEAEFRAWQAKDAPLKDRIRVCGYLTLVMDPPRLLQVASGLFSRWSPADSTHFPERDAAWKKTDLRNIEWQAQKALATFEEDVVVAEALAFLLNQRIREHENYHEYAVFRALFVPAFEGAIVDPLLSLILERIASNHLTGKEPAARLGPLVAALEALGATNISKRLAYQIRLMLARPAGDFFDLIARIQEAHGIKDAASLLAAWMDADYYVKGDWALIISALVERFGEGETGRVFADAATYAKNLDESVAGRLAIALSSVVLDVNAPEAHAIVAGDLLAKLRSGVSFFRTSSGISGENRTSLFTDMQDGGLRVVRRLRRFDVSKAPDQRRSYDAVQRLIVIFELNISLAEKLDEVDAELALYSAIPVDVCMIVATCLAIEPANQLLAASDAVRSLLGGTLRNSGPWHTFDHRYKHKLGIVRQLIVKLAALTLQIGAIPEVADLLPQFKLALAEYESFLKTSGSDNEYIEYATRESQDALAALAAD